MARVVVVNNVTLDGVMQAPARADEDPRDGFEHGGWAVPYGDSVMAERMGKDMGRGGALLLGRRTYEDFFAVWPGRPDNPYSAVLDNSQKYVASRTMSSPLPWVNSTLLRGEAPAAIAQLKHELEGTLTILGSGALIHSLIEHDLIDEYLLLICPIALGSGRRLFPEGRRVALEMTQSVVTTTGVVIANYTPVRAANDRSTRPANDRSARAANDRSAGS
jgi:dihydrofolate reductase